MKFLRQLEKAVPEWVGRGLLSAQSGQEIISFEKRRAAGGIPYLTVALSILGVLLLGSGVISFFAANWNWLPKIAKLGVLFGSMWFAYGAAGWLLMRAGRPLVAEALLLLGVILFGANIWLIAQIYHISAHYPNGVLTWALGALAAAWLLPSHPALCAAALLGILWTGMESFGFDRPVHWPYLVFWLACLPPLLRHQWRFAAHAQAIGLLFWSWCTALHVEWVARGAMLYLVQLYFLGYLALFLAGMLLERSHGELAVIVKRYSGLAALTALFLLTFPEMHRPDHWAVAGDSIAPAQVSSWLLATLATLLLVVAIAWRHRLSVRQGDQPSHLDSGWLLLAVIAVLIVVNLNGTGSYARLVPLLFNLVFFGGLVWLIYAGIATHDKGLVNVAFAFFAMGIVARYLDTFWTLLGRSYFFMGGGVVLLVAGIFLERGRRRITRGLQGA
jgi:uncharacterized membrane protein